MTAWDVICFAGTEWRSHPQRAHWVCRQLVALGHNVTFVENLGTRSPRLADYSRVVSRLKAAAPAGLKVPKKKPEVPILTPIVLPYQQWRLIRRLGTTTLERSLPRRGPRPLVVWTYLPLPVIADVARRVGADALVYDWADDASTHMLAASRQHRARIHLWEEQMAKRADAVFISSPELLRRRAPQNDNVHLIGHGVAVSPPQKAKIDNGQAKRIGFVGSITKWTDLDLLQHVATRLPDAQLVLVGPLRTDVSALRALPNVELAGEVPHEAIGALLSSFDVGLIPYKVVPATETASPLKLQEYLAHDLPIVSVDIPAARAAENGHVIVARSREEFTQGILKQLQRQHPEGIAGTPMGWNAVVAKMMLVVNELITD